MVIPHEWNSELEHVREYRKAPEGIPLGDHLVTTLAQVEIRNTWFGHTMPDSIGLNYLLYVTTLVKYHQPERKPAFYV